MFFTILFLALPLFRCQANPYEIFGTQNGKETGFSFSKKFGFSLSGSLHESFRRVHTLYISVDLHLRVLYLTGVVFNPINAELNLICPVLAVFGAHHILYVGR